MTYCLSHPDGPGRVQLLWPSVHGLTCLQRGSLLVSHSGYASVLSPGKSPCPFIPRDTPQRATGEDSLTPDCATLAAHLSLEEMDGLKACIITDTLCKAWELFVSYFVAFDTSVLQITENPDSWYPHQEFDPGPIFESASPPCPRLWFPSLRPRQGLCSPS